MHHFILCVNCVNMATLYIVGVANFVGKYPSVIESCIPSSVNLVTSCRKDLGDKGKLRLWSRGHIFIVRTCGHIDMWRPIFRYMQLVYYVATNVIMYSNECDFRSESPSQAFLIVISWLYEVLQNIPECEWRDVVLFYDNMCHLDSLRAATAELPLPVPYNNMWKTITKVNSETLSSYSKMNVWSSQKFRPSKIDYRLVYHPV